MPLNGCNFTQLVLLTPGAAPVEASEQGPRIVQERGGAISPSVAGQRGQQNNFTMTMDGVLNNSIYMNTWAISLPPDAMAEFNVQSHIEDAQAAISSGANINAMTRSGTRELHGAVWEFWRNDKLDARNFFDPSAKPPYRQNQYGTTTGGRSCFRTSSEGNMRRGFGYWVPIAEEWQRLCECPDGGPGTSRHSWVIQWERIRSGRSVREAAIYDLVSTRADPNKPGAYLKNPFAGNIIPASRLSPPP